MSRPETQSVSLRAADLTDVAGIQALYCDVAREGGGLARRVDEITPDHVEAFVLKALKAGLIFVAIRDGDMVGEIHGARPGPRQFDHVLGDLTLAIIPAYQGQGIGGQLLLKLIRAAQEGDYGRIELFCREGNEGAIRLYERLGFTIEGRLKGRVRLPDGKTEDDLVMGLKL